MTCPRCGELLAHQDGLEWCTGCAYESPESQALPVVPPDDFRTEEPPIVQVVETRPRTFDDRLRWIAARVLAGKAVSEEVLVYELGVGWFEAAHLMASEWPAYLREAS